MMITVVSGLPRSGTSLVMQMLAAGGHAILSDNLRTADDDNPKGYLEFEKVKSLERDQSWLADADGKAVKIVSFLLTKLPPGFDYRVIFLRRDLGEVLRSQSQMLVRCGQPAGPSDAVMQSHFERHLQSVDSWINQRPEIAVLNCEYRELIHDAAAHVERIAQFLALPLDVAKMAAVVDPDLYRQRSN